MTTRVINAGLRIRGKQGWAFAAIAPHYSDAQLSRIAAAAKNLSDTQRNISLVAYGSVGNGREQCVVVNVSGVIDNSELEALLHKIFPNTTISTRWITAASEARNPNVSALYTRVMG